uniref:Uncharacterized protein n=1 Tax=Avena sativa TaxID=4498 RepID=A0ACD5WEX6_AVESA
MSSPPVIHLRERRCTGPDAQDSFCKIMNGSLLRVNSLMMVNTILTAVMVGIGAYGRRYRHGHPLTRFLFLTATALFLPIVSYIVTTIDNQRSISVFIDDVWQVIAGRCLVGKHFILVMAWTGLVQIVGINITPTVATDAREGRNVGPPVVLLVQALWTSYLAFTTLGQINNSSILQTLGQSNNANSHFKLSLENTFSVFGVVLVPPFVIIFAKLIFKLYAWYKAGQSVALGRVPRLIVGYMEQLQSGSKKSPTELPLLTLTIDEHMQHIPPPPPPPLIVMGEDTVLVEKQHHGYSFKWPNRSVDRPTRRRNNDALLVTIDRIWQLNNAGFLIEMSTPTPQLLKDVCLSFSLFKLLRCRYARYTIAEAGFTEARNFLWHMLLEDCDDERLLMVMVHELSFLHDYYYSSLPISYSKTWLLFMSIFISLVSMAYCLLLPTFILPGIFSSYQLGCEVHYYNSTSSNTTAENSNDQAVIVQIGNVLYDYVQLVLLLALVMLAEVRDIASYICSNWTKVALICRYVNNTSWQQSPTIQKCIRRILQCRCTLLKHWEGKMSQCSILVLRPWRTPLALLRRLIHLPDEKKLVPRAVKAAVLHALRSYDEGSRSNGVAPLPSRLRGRGGNLIWEFDGTKGTAHTMLVCHIATSILEVRTGSQPAQHLSDHHIAATHLSRYCAYLVAHSPELLPDDDGWCKSLYKAVKKDADRVRVSRIAVSTPQLEYQQLVELLGTRSKHEVLKNGLELGKRLVDLAEAEEAAAWRVLAGFWSEMILYVAPSENLDGHAEAIARGGELITLLWALLTHVGIVRRADYTTTTAAAGSAPAVV